MSVAGRASLRAILESYGGSLQDLTVLAPQNDPFRVDTAAGHRDGSWLATTLAALDVTGQRHLRGLHYILAGAQVAKPDGKLYTNTEADWDWLSIRAAKCARWLGYIEFDAIVDERNDEPVVRLFTRAYPRVSLSVDYDVVIPDADDLRPVAALRDFVGEQPYRLVLVGEKSSLRPVLDPIAQDYRADLYLPTGEISDTQIRMMARAGADDGRPMVVFYFADCDPAGWQMAISVSRKLQAFIALGVPDLQLQVHRVALTPDQVRLYSLPSTPLKATERRADDWSQATGVAQTEIDALAALQPRVLADMASAALDPFFDTTLARRARVVAAAWETAAQAAIDEQSDLGEEGQSPRQLRARAADRLDDMYGEIQEILAEVADADDFDLPELPALPDPEVDLGAQPQPLLDTRWDFRRQCRALIDSKNYREL
jgi:hypothetical protein